MFNKIVFLMTLLLSLQVTARDIQLPPPVKAGTVSLMQALKNRHSDHSFSKQALSLQDLSNVLWVAAGVNRPDGKRTIPTAMNEKDLNIYVFDKTGIYLYDADSHQLHQVSEQNQLGLFQKQDYMKNVPVVLVYTAKNKDYGPMHAGSAYQNVGLYTATNQMASIVRGYFDKDEVKKAIGLSDNENVLISQSIGFK